MSEHNESQAITIKKIMATLPFFGFGGFLIAMAAYFDYAKIGASHNADSLLIANSTLFLTCSFKGYNPCSNSGVGGCDLPSGFNNIENKTRIEAACHIAQTLCQQFFNNKTVDLNVTLNGEALSGYCNTGNAVMLTMLIFGATMLVVGALNLLTRFPLNCGLFQSGESGLDNEHQQSRALIDRDLSQVV